MTESLDLRVGPEENRPMTVDGKVLVVPNDWALLPPGDAALTRRVKSAGPSWTVTEKRGRKKFSRGVWAPAETIAQARATLDAERATPAHARKLAAGRAKRDREQEAYVAAFEASVLEFLDFAPSHRDLARRLAIAIAAQATPVGSGTVARTQRIPVHERAEAATVAWLRHNTTAYDDMKIPRVKGMRREVRRLLAAESRRLLARYRRGEAVPAGACGLEQGLATFADSLFSL